MFVCVCNKGALHKSYVTRETIPRELLIFSESPVGSVPSVGAIRFAATLHRVRNQDPYPCHMLYAEEPDRGISSSVTVP